jgi:hypothetical protein
MSWYRARGFLQSAPAHAAIGIATSKKIIVKVRIEDSFHLTFELRGAL